MWMNSMRPEELAFLCPGRGMRSTCWKSSWWKLFETKSERGKNMDE